MDRRGRVDEREKRDQRVLKKYQGERKGELEGIGRDNRIRASEI